MGLRSREVVRRLVKRRVLWQGRGGKGRGRRFEMDMGYICLGVFVAFAIGFLYDTTV